jgi:hypothetical protein
MCNSFGAIASFLAAFIFIEISEHFLFLISFVVGFSCLITWFHIFFSSELLKKREIPDGIGSLNFISNLVGIFLFFAGCFFLF